MSTLVEASFNWPMGEPLHQRDYCERTDCVHCEQCGFGPHPYLIYRYAGGTTAAPPAYSNGLCRQCAGRFQ